MEDLPGNVPVMFREEVLPEVNELSHLKLEELCNKTGGRGCHTVHLSPSWKTALTSGRNTKASRATQCIHVGPLPPASINTSPKLQPHQSLLVLDPEWAGVCGPVT